MAEKILIVDDECEIADLVALYLENEGFEAPKFKIDESITDFYQFTKNSFSMEDYKFHEFKFDIPMAI